MSSLEIVLIACRLQRVSTLVACTAFNNAGGGKLELRGEGLCWHADLSSMTRWHSCSFWTVIEVRLLTPPEWWYPLWKRTSVHASGACTHPKPHVGAKPSHNSNTKAPKAQQPSIYYYKVSSGLLSCCDVVYFRIQQWIQLWDRCTRFSAMYYIGLILEQNTSSHSLELLATFRVNIEAFFVMPPT